MCGWSFTIITIILSSIILLVLKDLFANLKYCMVFLVEGNLASLHD
jgi:hypothetical protein